MYTISQYRQTKLNNSVLIRVENIVDALQQMLEMPCAVVGLHEKFKHAASGQEKDIRDITPRCILTWSGCSLDSQALTSFDQATTFVSTNPETGVVGKNVIPFRRLPMNIQFKVDIVLDNVEDALRYMEYVTMLAMQIPVVNGDEHTKTTLKFEDNWNIDCNTDKGDTDLSGSLTANCQILVPQSCAVDDFEYKLAGVGVLMSDGTWNETPKGEPILDDEGNPVLDDEGNPMIGDFVADGWYRLRHNIHIHPHRITDEHIPGDDDVITRGAGVEVINGTQTSSEDDS